MFATLPVNALRTFESAARLRSFKLAAAELAVTPTAISHQIKALEQQLGFALFERVPRGVRLTPKGETLFAGVHGALLDVAATLEGLRPQPSTGSLCVSVTHSFAALWLVPRLGRFYQAYPHYLVRLEACAEVIDLQQDASVDVAVRYSRAHYPALHQTARLEESFGVYAAPGLAAAEPENPVLITVKWGGFGAVRQRLARLVPGRRRGLVAAPCGDAQLSRGALRPAGGGGRAGDGARQLGDGVRYGGQRSAGGVPAGGARTGRRVQRAVRAGARAASAGQGVSRLAAAGTAAGQWHEIKVLSS